MCADTGLPRFYAKVSESVNYEVHTILCVPIILKNRTIGVIELLSTTVLVAVFPLMSRAHGAGQKTMFEFMLSRRPAGSAHVSI